MLLFPATLLRLTIDKGFNILSSLDTNPINSFLVIFHQRSHIRSQQDLEIREPDKYFGKNRSAAYLSHLFYTYSQPIAEGFLPPSLLRLTIRYGFNHPITPRLLPSSLLRLTFLQDFNQPLLPGAIPPSVTLWANILNKLSYQAQFHHQLIISYWDTIPHSYNLIPCNVLPPSIISFKLDYRFNQEILPGSLPESLEHLEFSSQYRKPFRVGSLPSSLRHLRFGGENGSEKVCFPANTLPATLSHLDLLSSFPQSPLPPSLTLLRLRLITDIKPGQLPQSLTHLDITRCLKNVNIIKGSLPSTLTHLVVSQEGWSSYDYPEKGEKVKLVTGWSTQDAIKFYETYKSPYSPLKNIHRLLISSVAMSKIIDHTPYMDMLRSVRRLDIQSIEMLRPHITMMPLLEHLTIHLAQCSAYVCLLALNHLTTLVTCSPTSKVDAFHLYAYLKSQTTLTYLDCIVTHDATDLLQILHAKPKITKFGLICRQLPTIPSTIDTLFLCKVSLLDPTLDSLIMAKSLKYLYINLFDFDYLSLALVATKLPVLHTVRLRADKPSILCINEMIKAVLKSNTVQRIIWHPSVHTKHTIESLVSAGCSGHPLTLHRAIQVSYYDLKLIFKRIETCTPIK
eukprot:gene1134-1296_t